MSDLVAAARTYLNVPFRHRGRSRAGIDCIGLAILSYRDIGIELVDRQKYGRSPERDGLREAMIEQFGPPVENIQVGDVVLMQWYQQPNHVAIVTDYPYGGFGLIHALASSKRVIEHRLAGPWPSRIVEGFRL